MKSNTNTQHVPLTMTSLNLTAFRGASHLRGSSSSSSSHIDTADDRVRRRLDALKASLEPAMKEGEQLLASFSKSLNKFVDDIQSEVLHEETHHMVYSFIDTVSIVSSALLEGSIASDAIHAKLESEIFRLAAVEFKNLSIQDRAPGSAPIPTAPYIEECYKWLLSHLHNPYPTKSSRSQFSEQSGASEKDIDAWFINVRKRIGWNDIRRAHFETRFDMVKAATRFFQPTRRIIRTSNDASSSDHQDYGAHFMAMKAEAETLYAHKFVPTTLATNLEKTVKSSRGNPLLAYPSPERSPSRSAETPPPAVGKQRKRRNSDVDIEPIIRNERPRPQRPLKRIRTATPSIADIDCASSLPSPAQSVRRELSYSMSPVVASFSLEEKPEILTTGHHGRRKRRHSDTSDYESDSSRAPRGTRRRRVAEEEDDQVILNPKRNLRNVKASHISQSSHTSTVSPTARVSAPPTEQTLKRKRRLSDAHDERPRKLPHHAALMVPRLHTVSNPLPVPSLSFDLEDIPTTLSADIPPLSNTTDFGDLQNLDVESFDYNSMPALKDYLSQPIPGSDDLDNTNASNSVSFVASGTHLSSTSSTDSTDPLALFNLDFSSPNQLSLQSYDGLFTDIHSAAQTITPEVMQSFPSTSDKLSTALNQTFDPTFNHNGGALLTLPSGVNPFDLMLYPNMHILPAHGVNPVVVADPSNMRWGPALGDTSQAALAIRKIHSLEAELEMCKNQLAQHGMFSF